MCSWCYAFDTVLTELESLLPDSICLKKIIGGLAADSDTPMPAHLINTIQSAWQQIEKTVPHVQFNYEFWSKNQPFRSTYPSCRAVLAAKNQSPVFENKMIQQIQFVYYKNAKNPSLNETLIQCAQRIGLNVELFKNDFTSQEIELALQKDIQFARRLAVSSYPSLRLDIDNQIVAINIDYINAQSMLKQIRQHV
jgi:putative protein-disulfide isomerase